MTSVQQKHRLEWPHMYPFRWKYGLKTRITFGMTQLQMNFIPLSFHLSVSPQGSQGSSASLSSSKVSNSVEDGDGAVTEGEEMSEC